MSPAAEILQSAPLDLFAFDMPDHAAPATPPARQSLRAHIDTVAAIADAIETLDDDALDADQRAEIDRELLAAIAGTRAKVDRVTGVMAMFEGIEASAIAERDRLAKRAAYYARQRERLEAYVLRVMEGASLDRIDGETSALARRKNPPSVALDAGATFAAEFMRPAPPPPPAAPDKAAIAKALKRGDAVAGARLTQTVRLVRT